VCRAAIAGGDVCRRCKADLSLRWSVERQREGAIGAARRAAIIGDFESSFGHIQQANELRYDRDLAQLRAVVHLLRGDFAASWSEYRTATGTET
jgi:hypothetical protein